jgi:peptidoglycan/xylan/chitin deacetylase (PgdA/CDA1 family)
MLPHDLDAAMFDAQLSSLSRVFRVLSLDDALDRLRNGTLPARALSITFDDGYRDNIEIAVPILNRHGMTATFFIATGFLDGGRMMHDSIIETFRRLPNQEIDLEWIGLGKRTINETRSRVTTADEFMREIKYRSLQEGLIACHRLAGGVQAALPIDLMMTSEQVRQLGASGMSVGAHTHDHTILSCMDAAEGYSQIIKSREVLTNLLGSAPNMFAYPNGKPDTDYRSAHVEMVKRAGFLGAASVSVGTATRNSDHFQVPRFVPWDRNPVLLVLRILAHRWRYGGTKTAKP